MFSEYSLFWHKTFVVEPLKVSYTFNMLHHYLYYIFNTILHQQQLHVVPFKNQFCLSFIFSCSLVIFAISKILSISNRKQLPFFVNEFFVKFKYQNFILPLQGFFSISCFIYTPLTNVFVMCSSLELSLSCRWCRVFEGYPPWNYRF